VGRFPPLIALAVFVVLATAPAPALGHPHIWIETAATFVFERGRLTAIRIEWTLDEMFSDSLIGSFDKNRNKRFDEGELRELREKAFDNLKELGFLTHLHIGGKVTPVASVSNFTAAVAHGRVIYRFTVRLPTPVDPVATPVRLAAYDPTYFVQMDFQEEAPVRFEGRPEGACQYDIQEDKTTPIYFGMVFPQEIRLVCKQP